MKKFLIALSLLFVLTNVLFADTTFVSGDVFGVWEISGSPYLITDEINVPCDSSLRIMPGCSVIFQGHYPLIIDSNAVLKAIGTEMDSIVFTAMNTHLTDSAGGHGGIRFYNTHGCSLQYCIIEYGNAIGDLFSYDLDGGGVYTFKSTISIENTKVKLNRSTGYGAGIFCDNSEVQIISCMIEYNNGSWGGGVCCKKCPVCIVRENQIIGNTGRARGGGITFDQYSAGVLCDNIIMYNFADWGGGVCCYSVSDLMIEYNLISENSISATANRGGGIDCTHSSPIIRNNIISNNTAPCIMSDGGGINISHGNAIIMNNKIHNNFAGGRGGGIYCERSPSKIINNEIYHNTSNFDGGGIAIIGTNGVNIVNCVIFNNYANLSGGGIFCRNNLKSCCFNSIICDNLADSVANDIALSLELYPPRPCTLHVAYSLLDTLNCTLETYCKLIKGPNVLGSDPCFVDGPSGNFKLVEGSPAIDSGSRFLVSFWGDTVWASVYDIEGNPRPSGLDWDMGVYEHDMGFSIWSNLYTGWNLISLQREVSIPTLEAILPFAIPPSYTFSPTLRTYTVSDTLNSGVGYWVFSEIDTIIAIEGEIIYSYTFSLYPGWNLIGALSIPIPVTFLDTIPEMLSMPFGYSSETHAYFIADTLFPGSGYWILATDTVVFRISLPD
ncbi:right-handed parallel beta-helix repeat-containing protein [bacterium]|nr:right-handed parallel beta-helix repeat-containing protein [bacterium]